MIVVGGGKHCHGLWHVLSWRLGADKVILLYLAAPRREMPADELGDPGTVLAEGIEIMETGRPGW